MRDNQNAVRRVLGYFGKDAHDDLTVPGIQDRRRLIGEDRGRIGNDGARDRDPLLLAPAQLVRIARNLVREPNFFQCVTRLRSRVFTMRAAYIKRHLDILRGRERRKQMIRLENEADMIPPEFREDLGVSPLGRVATDLDRPRGRCQYASKNREKRGLAAPRRLHQHGQLAAAQRQVDVPQRVHLRGTTSQNFCDALCFDDEIAHRVKTMTGSMRTTRKMAPSAAAMHMTTVRTNIARISIGVITTGSAPDLVNSTTENPMRVAKAKPMTALSSA